MTTTTDIATRRNGTPAPQQAALAIRPGQVMWDEYQAAALEQIGLKDASNADRAVFLHQCQRTGLDPFARQIYMIGRQEKQRDGTWRTKWTIQTGIDGYRVVRDRAEKRERVRVEVARPVWYDHEGNPFKVWFSTDPPTACEVTVTVDGRSYTSVLLFREYCQTKDGKPVAQWATKPAHMIEKCCEADAYRKAFPQDFSGVHLDDAMPPADDNAPPAQQRRVTAEQIRTRHPQQIAGEAGRDPENASSPAAAPAPVAQPAAPPAGTAGEEVPPARASSGQRSKIRGYYAQLGYTGSPGDQAAALRRTAKLARLGEDELASVDDLTQDQAAAVIRWLDKCGSVAELDELLASGETPEGTDPS